MPKQFAISAGQKKVLDHFKPGIRLMLDPATGRYAFFDGDTVVANVDQRPIEAMLRSGALTKDIVGRCYMHPDLDPEANLVERKTHLLGENGKPQVCRYTKHPRARAAWLPAAEFGKLDTESRCPDCDARLAALA